VEPGGPGWNTQKEGGKAEGHNKNTRQGIAISETKTSERQRGEGAEQEYKAKD